MLNFLNSILTHWPPVLYWPLSICDSVAPAQVFPHQAANIKYDCNIRIKCSYYWKWSKTPLWILNWSLHPPLKKRTTPLWMFLTSSQENEKKYKIGSIMCVTTFNVKLGCVKHQTSCKILDFWASILHGRGYWQEPFRSIIPYWLAQFRPKFPISIDWNITNKSCTSQIEKKILGVQSFLAKKSIYVMKKILSIIDQGHGKRESPLKWPNK